LEKDALDKRKAEAIASYNGQAATCPEGGDVFLILNDAQRSQRIVSQPNKLSQPIGLNSALAALTSSLVGQNCDDRSMQRLPNVVTQILFQLKKQKFAIFSLTDDV